MNVPLYEANLAVALGDPNNVTYSSSTIQTVMCLAVRAYRRWRSCLRPYASGVTYQSVLAGSNSLYVVGGPWAVGQKVVVGEYSDQETFTISAVTVGAQKANWIGFPLVLTLSGNLANAHAAGIRVYQPNYGLQVVAGQPNYQLPPDFVALDNRSFDLATGARAWVKRVESFYDGVYRMSALLEGVGWGQSQPFQNSGLGIGPGTFAAVPDALNTMNVPGGGGGQEMAVDIQPGNPPQMWLTPAPQSAVLWQFQYFAAHQPETVPDEDFDAVIDAGRAIAVELTGAAWANRPNYTEADVTRRAKDNEMALMAVGAEAYKRFESKIRRVPIFISG